jgi:hypothetical protein
VPEPEPMLGQLCVEPELEPFDVDPDEPDDPELALLDPDVELLELEDGGVVEVLALVLEPVVPVLDEPVVAASATSAPPVTRPAVSALIANTFRRRIFMVIVLSLVRIAAPSGVAASTLRPGPVARRTTSTERRRRSLKIA